MKLWIARDKNGSLYLFKKKPVLVTFDGVEVFDSNEEYFEIDSNLYSSVTIENSPQQVEINDLVMTNNSISKELNEMSNDFFMSYCRAQDYISQRGFDIPWNDCDVFVDERNITQTIGNVLKWADKTMIEKVSNYLWNCTNMTEEDINLVIKAMEK